jgi:hypothetical protein
VLVAALFVPEVAEALKVGARELALKDPFTTAVTRGQTALRLVEAAERSLERPPVQTARFEGEGAVASLWTAQIEGRTLQGCTAALALPGGGVEVRITARTLPVTTLWRDRVRGAAAGLVPEEAWELPEGTDLSVPDPDPQEVLDAQLPFPLAPETVFYSPVLLRPVEGAALVDKLIAHASATYGDRLVGAALIGSSEALFLWTGSVSGVPVEATTTMRLEQGLITSMAVYMQPWPAIRLFGERMRARSKGWLSPDYFEGP